MRRTEVTREREREGGGREEERERDRDVVKGGLEERSIKKDMSWNCFKENIGKTSQRCNGTHMDFPERIETFLNRTELTYVY